jgi:DNA-binding transcriptional LysR family regulator
MPSVGTKILPDLLATFRTNWPGIHIVLRESRDCADLIRDVESGDVDVTFLDIGVYETGHLAVSPLLDDPMMFLAPVDAPGADKRVVSIADIAQLPMIGTRNPACRLIIDEAFRQAPAPPTYIFRSDDNPTIQRLVGSGLAYSVLPMLAVDENDPNLALIPIRPKPPPRRLGIAWHPERRRIAALLSFTDAAADLCRDLAERWAAAHAA